MKKFLVFLLILSTMLSICSCSSEYDPPESTEEELRVVINLSCGDRTYPVHYETYRALFLTYKSELDGGDESLWEGEGAEELIARANERILERLGDIYSVLYACEQVGIDLYSAEVEDTIEDYVKFSVEGGVVDGDTIEGYGSFEDYLAALAEMNLNYSVQTLLFRYSIGVERLEQYYLGTDDEGSINEDEQGELTYTRDDVRAFYDSDECVRVLRTYIQDGVDFDIEARLERVRDAIVLASYDGDEAVAAAMIANGSLIAESEVFNGYVIAPHNLDLAYFGEMVDAAFSLDEGEVSDVITVHDGRERVHYILYRAEKSEEHFTDCYGQIAYVYLRNRLGQLLAGYSQGLQTSVEYTDEYLDLSHSNINMED